MEAHVTRPSSKDVSIRPLREGDYPAADVLLCELHRLHAEARPDLYRPAMHPYSGEEFRYLVADAETLSLAAEVGGHFAGLCIAMLRLSSKSPAMVPERIAYVEDLCVHPDFRRAGVGRLLFERVEDLARERGAKRLELMVWSFNRDAALFYERLGMTPQRFILEKPLI